MGACSLFHNSADPTISEPGTGHPRRPRGSQSGREKRRDESFQVRAKEPLGTYSHRTISKNSSRCRLLIGHKKCFVLLCPIGEQFLLSSFSWVDTRQLLSRSRLVWLMHQIPIWFQNTVCPKINPTLSHKYKLELATGIHPCIGHFLRKNYGVFKRYHDDWRPQKRRMEKWIHTFSVSIVIIPTRLLCQMQANSPGAEFLSFSRQNVKLGIFKGSRTVDGKEMYKKVWRTCKVAVFPCQAIAYLTFSSPPHLKLPIIYDTL